MSTVLPASGLLVSVLMAFACGAQAAGDSPAGGGIEKSTEYYAEADHQHLVGELIRGCGARPQHWGRKTAFTLESTAPCGGGARRQDTVAAHILMHQDPLTICRQRCDSKPHTPTTCGPNDPPEACGAGTKLACYQACSDAYGPDAPAP